MPLPVQRVRSRKQNLPQRSVADSGEHREDACDKATNNLHSIPFKLQAMLHIANCQIRPAHPARDQSTMAFCLVLWHTQL